MLANLPIPAFFVNSVIVSVVTSLLNVLVASLAPTCWQDAVRRPGAIFYALLATLIVGSDVHRASSSP